MDTGFESFGVSDYCSEVLDADADVEFFFYDEGFEVEDVDCDGCLEGLLEDFLRGGKKGGLAFSLRGSWEFGGDLCRP